MRRQVLCAGSVIAILLGVLLGIVVLRLPDIQKWLRPPTASLPDDSEIQSLRAALYDSSVGFKPIDEFAVPPDHVSSILFWFRPSKYDKRPAMIPGDTPLGELKIITKTGGTRTITFFWSGHNPPVFTENGIDYYYGGGSTNNDGYAVDGGIMAGKAIEAAHSESLK